eukprot:1249619-Prymnesium_polylepis.1
MPVQVDLLTPPAVIPFTLNPAQSMSTPQESYATAARPGGRGVTSICARGVGGANLLCGIFGRYHCG